MQFQMRESTWKQEATQNLRDHVMVSYLIRAIELVADTSMYREYR